MNRKTKKCSLIKNTKTRFTLKSIHWEFQWNVFYVHKNSIKKREQKEYMFILNEKKNRIRTHKIVCFLEKGAFS